MEILLGEFRTILGEKIHSNKTVQTIICLREVKFATAKSIYFVAKF